MEVGVSTVGKGTRDVAAVGRIVGVTGGRVVGTVTVVVATVGANVLGGGLTGRLVGFAVGKVNGGRVNGGSVMDIGAPIGGSDPVGREIGAPIGGIEVVGTDTGAPIGGIDAVGTEMGAPIGDKDPVGSDIGAPIGGAVAEGFRDGKSVENGAPTAGCKFGKGIGGSLEVGGFCAYTLPRRKTISKYIEFMIIKHFLVGYSKRKNKNVIELCQCSNKQCVREMQDSFKFAIPMDSLMNSRVDNFWMNSTVILE